MSAHRQFSHDELRDPWIRFYELAPPSGGPLPFPSSRNHREVDRAARAIIAGRSPGVEGWIAKRIAELAAMRVDKETARRDIEALREAIECRIVRLRMTEDSDEE